jgi:hypothetical protein
MSNPIANLDETKVAGLASLLDGWAHALRERKRLADLYEAADDVDLEEGLWPDVEKAMDDVEDATWELLGGLAVALGVEACVPGYELEIGWSTDWLPPDLSALGAADLELAKPINGGWGPMPVQLAPEQIIDDPIPF